MKRIVIWILYIFMGVQIAFGCVYLVSNFGVVQQFRENLSFLLPMGAVSLIQLVLAAVSTWYLLGKLGFGENRYVRAYACAFLLTVPCILQLHMAGLVWSVSLSALLWMLGLLLEGMKSGLSGRRAALLLAAYFLYGILCPDGVWLGAVLLFAGFLFSGKERQKRERVKRLRFGAAVIAAACVICIVNAGLNKGFPEERRIYRENTFGAGVLSRFVWPNLGKNYYFWNEDVKAILPPEEAEWIDKREDLVGEEFYPLLEETYGRKKAIKLCVRMGQSCLEIRTKEVAAEIGRDFRDYLLLPFTIERNLKGEGTSLTAWNYGRMKEHTPVLVKYYFRYGTFEVPFLLLGSILLWSFERSSKTGRFLRQKAAGGEREEGAREPEEDGKIPVQWKYMLFTAIVYALWYTMRSNIPIDYKAALPVLFVWYLASVSGLLCRK